MRREWNQIENTLDEYVEKLQYKSSTLEKSVDLEVNKDRMIKLSKDMDIRQHGIIIGDKLIFPHAFLRRYGHSNFVDINCLFSKLLSEGKEVYVRLDPFKKSSKKDYQDMVEMDHFYGPKFTDEILFENTNFHATVHYTDLGSSKSIYSLAYPLKYTIFRPSWLDKEKKIVQYYIEELIAPRNLYRFGEDCSPPYAGEQYVVQKYVHFTFDRIGNYFEHIDGSMRVFEKEEYKKLYENFDKTQKVYPQHIEGIERYKLFQVCGKLKREEISILLKEYLMYNPHIKEYFERTDLSHETI